MKIIISPAKSLDFESKAPTSLYTNSEFIEQSVKLNKKLKTISRKGLSDLMKISDDLASLNYERNKSWELPFTLDNAKQAVYSFTGEVYKGLDANSISEDKLPVLQDTLRILSGLYGLLKPLDLIQPYRLEMGTKLKVGRKENLYQFWGEELANALNNELKEGELLVNLASSEYFKALPKKVLKTNMITPVFKDFKNGKYKIIMMYAKKARGAMARYIIDNNINSIEGLKGFNIDGYAILMLLLLMLLFIPIANTLIINNAQSKIYSSIKTIPKNKVGLLLGTSKYLNNGNVNLYYKYRLNATIKLYKANKIEFIIVSGDNSRKTYDEPTDFKNDLIKAGIPENKIYLDYAGFRTLDSVVRAKEIFNQKSITIISQQFHNERAIYLAEHFNVKAIGFNAKSISGRYGIRVKLREYLARVKVFVDIVFKVSPKFLGEKIKVV